MATRVVEGKKPYTGGKAISIDENKVISLNLRDENNLIIYDEGDDEIYVDLQLDDEITPTSAFPIGVNVGRVIVDNGWDKPGTIISAETTSGDNIKIFYADEGTLWIDNGTGTFKQIYFKSDVDALLLALRNYIDGELAKKQNGVSSDTAPSNPSEGDLWYDTTNSAMKVWDGTAWQSVGGGDVLVSDQANNIFTPGMKIWGGTETDYQSLTPDSNTAYLLLAGGPTPPVLNERPDLDQYSLLGSTTLGFTGIHGIAISSDGTKLYACPANGYIRQYTLTGGLITGISAEESQTSGTVNTRGLYVKSDGSRLFSISDTSEIYNISMSTDFSLTGSTITSGYLSGIVQNDNPVGVRFTPDGNYFFTCRWDDTNKYLYKIPVTTAWDITSYTSTGATSVLLSEGYAYNVAISPTGLKVFTGSGNYIYQYNLSTPRDITTATYSGKSLAITERATFSVADNGDIFQTPTDSTGDIYQYRAS